MSRKRLINDSDIIYIKIRDMCSKPTDSFSFSTNSVKEWANFLYIMEDRGYPVLKALKSKEKKGQYIGEDIF